MGSATFVSVDLISSTDPAFAASDIVSVETTNSGAATVAELWLRVNNSYETYSVQPVDTFVTTGTIAFADSFTATYSASLPGGTAVYGAASSFTAGTNGIAYTNGNVGIGTSYPATGLDIAVANDSSKVVWSATIRNQVNQMVTGYGAGLKFKNNAVDFGNEGNKWVGIAGIGGTDWSDQTDMAFYGGGSPTVVPVERMRMNGQGNFGIGTSTPNWKLDVSGDVNIATSYVLRFNGTQVCAAAGCTATSDRRLKENILPLQDSLDHVLKLQGVTYDWKDKEKFGKGQQVGLIAQDLEMVYPQVVLTDAKSGLKSVAYDHLIAPVIESIKALYYRIVALESHQGVQDRQIASLQAENAALKNKAEQTDAKVQKVEMENAEMKARLERLEKLMGAK
jgi:hypothetical protein